MSFLFPNYARKEIEIVKGEGHYLFDAAGKRYLDFTSGIGVANLGYNHPVLNQALREQASQLWHTPNLYTNRLQEKVAEQLSAEKEYVAYFCNSGAEANEAAIKLARKATGKTTILSFKNSFHGRTYGAMSATGQEKIQEGFQPILSGFSYLSYNDTEALEAAMNPQIAAVMLEMIQGEGGVIPAEKEWIKKAEQLCRKYGALLIVDEIQTGMGRTGELYAYEHYQIEPDIFTLAKGLGNGIPVGAMLGKKELASSFGPGSHGSTFGGNKLALSVAEQVISLINDPEFLAEVKEKGTYLQKELQAIAASSEQIIEVRGRGLMIGIELDTEEQAKEVMDKLEDDGLLALKAGTKVLRLLPPLTLSMSEVDEGIEKIQKALK